MAEEQFFDFWFSAEKEDPKMIEFVKKLKDRGLKIFILSNNFIERANYYKKTFPFLEEIFDKIFYSWKTGFVKPDPEVYKNLLAENNLKPEECIYFDDSKKNIKVAKKLGIQSFIFEGIDSVENLEVLKDN